MMDPKNWRSLTEYFEEQPSVIEALVPGFLWQVEQALSQGVQHGYLATDEAGMFIRGRLRFDDQMRLRQSCAFPVEITYDEFTPDIDLNRLLKAALYRLAALPRRTTKFDARIRRVRSALAPVSLVSYRTNALPSPVFSRLDDRYRPAIALAKLILRSTSFDQRAGAAPVTGFLVDMNQVFEDFVVIALRAALRVSDWTFPQGAQGRSLTLEWCPTNRQKYARPEWSRDRGVDISLARRRGKP